MQIWAQFTFVWCLLQGACILCEWGPNLAIPFTTPLLARIVHKKVQKANFWQQVATARRAPRIPGPTEGQSAGCGRRRRDRAVHQTALPRGQAPLLLLDNLRNQHYSNVDQITDQRQDRIDTHQQNHNFCPAKIHLSISFFTSSRALDRIGHGEVRRLGFIPMKSRNVKYCSVFVL